MDFDNFFSQIQDSHEQTTKLVVWNTKSKPRQPWTTTALIELVELKSTAYKLYREKKGNKKQYIMTTKHAAIGLNMNREKHRKSIIACSKLLDENTNDPQKFWGIVNKVRGKREANNITDIKIYGQSYTTFENANKIANSFNEYFNNKPGCSFNKCPAKMLKREKKMNQ